MTLGFVRRFIFVVGDHPLILILVVVIVLFVLLVGRLVVFVGGTLGFFQVSRKLEFGFFVWLVGFRNTSSLVLISVVIVVDILLLIVVGDALVLGRVEIDPFRGLSVSVIDAVERRRRRTPYLDQRALVVGFVVRPVDLEDIPYPQRGRQRTFRGGLWGVSRRVGGGFGVTGDGSVGRFERYGR